jgi:hypothetical protein
VPGYIHGEAVAYMEFRPKKRPFFLRTPRKTAVTLVVVAGRLTGADQD